MQAKSQSNGWKTSPGYIPERWRCPDRLTRGTERVEAEPELRFPTILWRRRWTILSMIALGALAGYIAYRVQSPMYEATASLEMEPPNDNFLNLASLNPTLSTASDAYISTQMEVLRSRLLLKRVVQKMDLQRKLNVASADAAVEVLSGGLKVDGSQGSRIISLRYRSTNPRLAAGVANTLGEEYIEDSLDARWMGTQRTANWLGVRLQDLKTHLEGSEAELQTYARESGLLATSDKENVAEQRLRQLQEELSRAQADSIQKQAHSELSDTAAGGMGDSTESEVLRTYGGRLAELKQKRAELSALLTPAHYKVQQVEGQIAELNGLIAEERLNIGRGVQKGYLSAKRREELLREAFGTQQALVSSIAAKSVHYNMLKRDVDSSRLLYESLLQRVKEAGVASAIRATNIRIVDPAVPPTQPYKPQLWIDVMAGMTLTFCAGGCLAFALDASNGKLRAPGDASVYLAVPELGVIPRDRAASPVATARSTLLLDHLESDESRNSGRNRNGRRHPLELATWRFKNTYFAESYRQTLASVMFTLWKRVPGSHSARRFNCVLLVTSPSPAEGKTTAACNLAIALARMSYKVLLVDADIRNPRLHEVFNVPRDPGLTTHLDIRHKAGVVPHPTEVPNLFIMPAGPANDDAQDLMSSPSLKEALNGFRREFDAIILDTPPLLLVADARLLAPLADAAVLVVRAGKTDRTDALAAVRRLENDNIPLLGTILTDWKPESSVVSRYYTV